MSEIFTDEHKNYINKKISKALKNINYDEIVKRSYRKRI